VVVLVADLGLVVVLLPLPVELGVMVLLVDDHEYEVTLADV